MTYSRKITTSVSMAVLAVASFQTFEGQGRAQTRGIQLAAKAACGGENQNSCWNVNPRKWCEPGLQYVPGAVGRRGKCIRPTRSEPIVERDPTPNCGGIGQSSCWNVNPNKWCDPGLIYRAGGLPGRGRCLEPRRGDMLDYTRAVASRYSALGKDNELARLRNCINSPFMKVRMIGQMRLRSTNGTNSLLRECRIDPEKLQRVAAVVLGEDATPPDVGPNPAPPENDQHLAKKFRLFFEFSGGAAAGSRDLGGAIGYAIPLHKKPLGTRWYVNSMTYTRGFDLGAGADILIGLGMPGVPSGDDAIESGEAGVMDIAAIFKGGLTTRLTNSEDPSFAIFGGVGAGLTAATFDFSNDFYPDR